MCKARVSAWATFSKALQYRMKLVVRRREGGLGEGNC